MVLVMPSSTQDCLCVVVEHDLVTRSSRTVNQTRSDRPSVAPFLQRAQKRSNPFQRTPKRSLSHLFESTHDVVRCGGKNDPKLINNSEIKMKVTCILPFVALWSSFVAGFSSCHSRSGMVRVVGLPLLRSDNQAYHHFQHRSSSVNHNGNWPWTLMKGTTCSRFFMIPNMDSSPSLTLIPRGGSSGNDGSSSRSNKKKTKSNMSSRTTDDTGTKYPATGGVSVISSLWGTGGVLYILSKALQRIIPVALEPFKEGALRPLSQLELGYVDTSVTCLSLLSFYQPH